MAPGADTSRSLILVMNCILLSAVVGSYFGCKNVRGESNMKSVCLCKSNV
jgi:hypothetical protein